MDKRFKKGIAFAAGLLVLLTALLLCLYMRMEQQLQAENDVKLGQLLAAHPEYAGEYLSIFEGKTDTGREEALAAASGVRSRYGYTEVNRKRIWPAQKFLVSIIIIILLSCCCLSVIFLLVGSIIRSSSLRVFGLEDKVMELERDIESLREKIKKEEADTKSLVTDLSHQLKTPLASLKMCYEIAEGNDFTEEERLSFLGQGRSEVQKLENLTESLIQLSRLEAGMIQIKPAPSSLKETLLGAVNNVFMKAFEKNISISVNEFDDAIISHDSRWTQEAIVNILDNAVKYSEKDSGIRLNVSSMVSYYLIEIEDEGIGIAKEEANQIFKRFYRGDSEKIRRTEGSGVGLYLTRKILEEQGGSIRVKKGRKGSIFQLTLPKQTTRTQQPLLS